MWRSVALWQLHPPVVLLVRASPAACVQTLVSAARPSLNRLHLRNLFIDGRRYFVQPTRDGFRVTINSKTFEGGRRRRTAFAATVSGAVRALDEETTLIRLNARIHLFYVLRGLFMPLWMSGILLFMPWQRGVIAGLIIVLFTLAWVGHRFNAALQAADMVYFVQKALEDLPPVEAPALEAGRGDVVTPPHNRDFREQWERFYEERRGD
jgi:hypothetical protein